ncbi:hypothetical protein TrVE_jg1199 [Triparma verrucosa]|uniref:ribonuclease Z n=1 Tax=Triparma verrucosa TaxID=1606542 RepID=A0A9W7C2S7_9STRA|nr:hypothetical protein TrVE_jg1199 [Triparma verrucosa]
MITLSMLSPPPNPLIALSPTLLICPPSGTQRFLLSTGHRTSKVTHIVPSPPDLAGVNGLILTKSGTSPEGSITLLDETGYTKKYLGVSRPYSFRPQFTTNVEGASEPVMIPLHQPASCELTIIPLSDPAPLDPSTPPPPKKQRVSSAGNPEPRSKLIRIEGSTPGTFDRKAALSLGVPVGPLFGKLVKGETIVTPSGEEVKPSQCMGEPGVWRVAVAYVESENDFERLPKSQTWDFVYFQSTPAVLESQSFKGWWSSLKLSNPKCHLIKCDSSKPRDGYVSSSSAKLAYKLSLISPNHFRVPYCVDNCFKEIDYRLTPVNKKGLVKSDENSNMYGLSSEDRAEVEEDLAKRGLEKFLQTKEEEDKNEDVSVSIFGEEIVFLGTGSSIPSKHRNVTSTWIKYGSNSLLLDCGENSVTQLKCLFSNDEDYRDALFSIKFVWVSHPHADHLLGLNEFVMERRRLGGSSEKVFIIAPETVLPSVKFFVGQEVGVVMLDCREFLDGIPDVRLASEFKSLGITKFHSLHVEHCRGSFGVVLECSHWGTVAFSGDCRPCRKFLNFKADILIHEATFEDDLQEEAIVKKHSTITEAVTIGRGMQCSHIILSHFSQRYPGMPRGVPKDDNVIVAWDWMRLTSSTMKSATRLGGVMEAMFEEEDKEGNEVCEGEDEIGGRKVKDIMKEPGGFAVKGVLEGGCEEK